MRHDLKSSMFFNNDGLFAEADRIILRRPAESNVPGFIKAFSAASPAIAKWYEDNSKARDLYWQSINDEKSLYCSICSKQNGEFFGYCTIEDLEKYPFELGINLIAKHHSQGIGSEAIAAFMQGFEEIAGPTEFLARIESRNSRSQHMFRKLGFIPAGIDAFLIDDPGMLEKLEEMQLDCIDANLRTVAEEFGVEPRVLLSHLLVFKRPISLQHANPK